MASANKFPKLEPFLFLGVDVDPEGHPKEAIGDCPFCDKEGHFYISKATGQWQCKVCTESGNIPSFIRKFHEACWEHTAEEALEELAEERGIPLDVLWEHEVAVNYLLGHWLFPVRNPKGVVVNLLSWAGAGSHPMGITGQSQHLMGVDRLKKAHTTVWVCEGPWDLMAWEGVLRGLKEKRMKGQSRLIPTTNPEESLLATHAVVAVPGSGNFKDQWVSHFDGREVKILFDNDHPRKNKANGKTVIPGHEGAVRTAMKIGTEADSVEMLKWGAKGYTKSLPTGFDVRDLVNRDGPIRALAFVSKHLEEVTIPDEVKAASGGGADAIEPEPCSSFAELESIYSEALHFTDTMRHTLVSMLATVISTDTESDQVWLRVIGPPGSGKSTLAEAINADHQHVISTDIITGITSGYRGGKPRKGGGKKDASLVEDFMGKTVIIKDGDTLINAPNRDQVLAHLRAFYDGAIRARYRNYETKVYENIRTTFIICATDEIRSLNRTFLGERFLDCEILGHEDSAPYVSRAVGNTLAKVSAGFGGTAADNPKGIDDRVKAATFGFLLQKVEGLATATAPVASERVQNQLEAIAKFLSFMRARVRRENHGKDSGIAYRPRVELATRLGSQLSKLAVFVAYVLDKSEIDEEVLAVIRKVALDTANGFPLEITQALWKNGNKGMAKRQLSVELGLAETTVWRQMQNMAELKIITRREESNRSGVRGRNLHLWRLTADIRALCKKVGI